MSVADSTFEDVEQIVKPSPLEILGETLDRHKFRPSIGQALLLGYLLGREAIPTGCASGQR